MKFRHRWFVLLLGIVPGAAAADITALMKDVQRASTRGESVDIVLWMPREFWAAVLQQDPRVSTAARAEFLSGIEDITIFAVISGRVSATGGVRARTREQILGTLDLKVGEDSLSPLADEDLTETAQTLINVMKPMIGKMLGPLGEGMEFVVYRNIDDEGLPLLNPLEAGGFDVELRGETHHWRLPLGSLLPPKFDPDTGEEFPGNYQFSPFSGKELVDEEPSASTSPPE